MEKAKIRELVSQLTLEEKAGLCSGRDNWFTKAVERLGIPAVRTSDGPHGLRTQAGETNSLDEGSSIPAVCFPAGCATASSFDRELLNEMGHELGREAQALGVNVLLGPGVNIKRSPLCGRNFEYFSEDPLVAGELGAAFVNGLQAEGVGASLKHFFANSQEHRRMDSSSEPDERTLREIYLPAFETVVKKSQPWTVMASYNKVHGVHSTQNKKALSDMLREEWGFEGLVVSDWGATHDRAAAVDAGCDLTMPAEDTDHLIVDAVRNGELSEEALDRCCERVIELAFKAAENARPQEFDHKRGHALARKIAGESMVLLKNENNILPLDRSAKIAFIGGFAKSPRYQGGGSSHITSNNVTNAFETAQNAGYSVTFSQGYPDDGVNEDENLLNEAVSEAKAADIAVVFAGLPEQAESEGVDRSHMDLPVSHNKLIEAVCAANPNTVVVLHHGAPVEMPWAQKPAAILDAYLGGEAVGEAAVDVLFGEVSPSGHLAETLPEKLSDNPSYLFYGGEGGKVEYPEKFFVGYRYYTSKNLEPLYHFGHGLCYTEFRYSDLTVNKSEIKDTDTLTASVTVTNVGSRRGKALVQLYIAPPRQDVIRPLRELKGFEKVELAPNESRTVTFTLDKRAFAHWSEDFHDWRVEGGEYKVQICENAASVILETPVKVTSAKLIRRIDFTLDTPMVEYSRSADGYRFLDENIGHLMLGMARAGFMPKEAAEALESLGTINLAVIDAFGAQSGASSGGTGAVDVLFGQPIAMMASFLPEDKKNELNALMNKLNDEQK